MVKTTQLDRFLDFLANIKCQTNEPVGTRPSDEVFDTILQYFADAVHKLFNNSCRSAGVPVEDGASERTWEYAEELMGKLESVIRSCWRKQDEQQSRDKKRRAATKAELRRDLKATEARAAELRRQLEEGEP